MCDKKNLWILTEERPKPEVIGLIFERYAKEKGISAFIDKIRIVPICEKENTFAFQYEVLGVSCRKIENIYIKIISGTSSFVDFLVFEKTTEPNEKDKPILIIEETKTDGDESRNTGIYQRTIKFIYVNYYYPKVKKIMLYNFQTKQKKKAPADTIIFGTRCLLTLGVEVMGKTLHSKINPFKTIEEIIKYKKGMKAPPKGNVPITIKKYSDKIIITGRLDKARRLSYDPNIGALSLISAALRKLGWNGRIVIKNHRLKQKMITNKNKFIRVANMLNIEIDGLIVPKTKVLPLYWYYEKNGEKIGTIFLHLLVNEFGSGMAIYENHAGSERGYFIGAGGQKLVVGKYTNQAQYKAGNKKAIIALPDLTLIDCKTKEALNIEGEKTENVNKGIVQLNGFTAFENLFIKKHYPKHKIKRTVVLSGGEKDEIESKYQKTVSLLLNGKGDIILALKAPRLYCESIKNYTEYWLK